MFSKSVIILLIWLFYECKESLVVMVYVVHNKVTITLDIVILQHAYLLEGG
jgi:hypothetical protein